MHAAGFVEDGSVSDDDRPAARSAARPTSAPTARATAFPIWRRRRWTRCCSALGIETPEDAVAFFRRHAARRLSPGSRSRRGLPPPPEYHGPAMDLSVEIDRGDVWYDFPFDARGQRLPQPRERFPTFTLFVKWRGEKVPLVRWRTTVGGWRAELASDGQEYYRYKGSDVGPRVWHHIVAAPVWIPPASSPLSSFVKEKRVNGIYARVTNYDETGPGYLSAYGLAAAIHEEMRRGPDGPRFFDNGIRTHGSFDYLSLRGRFSHGCHRLYNQQAMRLFSFVLAHRRCASSGRSRWVFAARSIRRARCSRCGCRAAASTTSSIPRCRSTSSKGRSKGRCRSRSPATSPSRASSTPRRRSRRHRPRPTAAPAETRRDPLPALVVGGAGAARLLSCSSPAAAHRVGPRARPRARRRAPRRRGAGPRRRSPTRRPSRRRRAPRTAPR